MVAEQPGRDVENLAGHLYLSAVLPPLCIEASVVVRSAPLVPGQPAIVLGIDYCKPALCQGEHSMLDSASGG
jgi:hypothetical protein